MNERTCDLITLSPAWVSATKGVEVPVALMSEQLGLRVAELRAGLRTGNLEGLDLQADDQGLAVLSRLCFELSTLFVAEDSFLREAAAAYDLVSGLSWPSDQFGERNEILTQFALMAWRCSREIGTVRATLGWESKYRSAFSHPSAASECLECFLATDVSERSDQLIEAMFCDVSAVFGVLELLQTYRDVCPAKAATESSFLYRWMSERGSFRSENERNYLLGVAAMLVGTNCRSLGRRASAAEWFTTAHSCFRKLRNSDPELAKLEYGRLTLSYERRQYDRVISEMPLLLARFRALGMDAEVAKCEFVEAMALKECGNEEGALFKLLDMEKSLSESDPCRLLGGVIAKIGELYSAKGQHREAMHAYKRALPLLRGSGRLDMLANLKGTVAETCRDMGNFRTAIDLYREAIGEYAKLEMTSFAAYSRILLAETLLLAGYPSEAEIEILAALPTIEREQMVEDGCAALNLLRESVYQCKTDESSLRVLCERMNGNRR